MSRDITVVLFRRPDAIDDPLTELAREGACRMLAQAQVPSAKADAFVAQWKDLKLPDGPRFQRKSRFATSPGRRYPASRSAWVASGTMVRAGSGMASRC